METTLKNGKRYSFNETWKGHITAYCLYDDKWNPLPFSFKTWDEVDSFCEKINYDCEHPRSLSVGNTPLDYYNDTTRYYGD